MRRRNRGPVIEVETLADFDRRLRQHPTSISGWHLQAVDLRERSEQLRQVDVAGALFLGCQFADGDGDSVRARGAVVFPQIPDTPVDTYRSHLYTAEELFDSLCQGAGGTYGTSLDARVHAWSKQPSDLDVTLAQVLHDHAIDDALSSWVQERQLVGVMGGHALRRDQPAYAEAARLGALLAATGRTVATGGGPGAMEAANLGARLGEGDLGAALATVSQTPSFRPDVDAWVRAGLTALDTSSSTGRETLGIPTWHYGHEPPNPFATAIAKYFRNATREATLLEICDAGIVFLPGAAGTVQEVFQDACENYYADPSSIAPMVLVGREHWSRTVPAWPLLESLAAEREMAASIHLVDTVEEAAALLT